MAAPGFNWHQIVGGTAITLGNGLTLARSTGYNIVWLGAGASNTNTIYIGYNSNLTVPSNGTAAATDGWPLAAGKTLPLLIGEGFDCGANLYAIAGAAAQDLFIIGY
jgi:hypothetical protein